MRRRFVFIILVVVLAVIVAWLSNYLSTGTVIITTDNKESTVTLLGANKNDTRVGMGSLEATIKHGLYTATVRDGAKTSVQIIDFRHGHKELKYNISTDDLLPLEFVARIDAQEIAATSNELLYIDGAKKTLHKINSSNNIQVIDPDIQFKSMSWGTASFGVGQENVNNLYVFEKNKLNLLDTPFSTDESTSIAVSRDKAVYVSSGQNIYTRSADGFKKIYTSASVKPVLAAGLDTIAISDTKYGASGSDIKRPLLSVFSSASGKIKKKFIEAEQTAWSSDGQFLATVNQNNPVIYNSSLEEMVTIPTNFAISKLRWLNNRVLVYASGSQVWLYNTVSKQAKLIAYVPSGDSINSLSINDRGNVIYLNVYDASSSNFALKRISLGDLSPNDTRGLENFLPKKEAGYTIDMINFSGQPNIVVKLHEETPSANYIPSAKMVLQRNNFSVDGLRFTQVSSVH